MTLRTAYLPELGTPTRGKVRDIYDMGDRLLMIATDRISCFDVVLKEQIEHKGALLTEMAVYWFRQTNDIVQNHVLIHPDPNVLVVKKCTPLPIEVVVRGYMAGSLWRDYAQGKRRKCGVALADRLRENQILVHPIVTPTTKAKVGHDEDISSLELITSGCVTAPLWTKIEETALRLFARGQELAEQQGLLLVDTKYEFGLAGDELVLIDEIHTPDSSRYWFQKEYEAGVIRPLDKEYVRNWLRSNDFHGEGPVPSLPADVQAEATRRYTEAYGLVTGQSFAPGTIPIKERLVAHLRSKGLLQGCFVPILMGSEKDVPFVQQIEAALHALHIPHGTHIASAHKQPQHVLKLIAGYEESMEPLVYITVAGRSNALSGMVAAQTKWPVIACPHFADKLDYLVNIHSTLQMPSAVPVLPVLDPQNAALACARILGR